MVTTVKFSEFAASGQPAIGDITVGLKSGANTKFENEWDFYAPGTTAERPLLPTIGVLRFNTDDFLYEYFDGDDWVKIDTNETSGTVLPGLQYQLAYYPGDGSTVDGLATAVNGILKTDGSGAPSISQTLPTQVQNNITLVGTIVSGVWQGSPITLTGGGTNANLSGQVSNGGIVWSNATQLQILAGDAIEGKPLLSGDNSVPSWAPYTLTLGGAFSSQGAVTFSGAFSFTGTVTGNTSVTFPTSGTLATTTGSIANADNIGITNDTTTNATMFLTWVTANTGYLPAKVTSTKLTFNPSTGSLSSTSFSGTWLGSNIDLSHGGTNASLTASNGGIVYSTATAFAILAGIGTNNHVVISQASAAPIWSTITIPTSVPINQLIYAASANDLSGLATVNRASLSTNSTGVPTWLPLTDGQIVIGSTAGSPGAATLTQGTGILISNGSNSITISSTGVAQWVTVTGTTQAMVSNTGYISNNAAMVEFTLPVTSSVGDELRVVGQGAGGWAVLLGTGQQIRLGDQITTATTGSISSTHFSDAIHIVCIVANTLWTQASGPQGQPDIDVV